ncbi:MAG: HAMP domain-containing histidine kinase [Bdellovibrionales bacterium]|nr:HAMP domain-containing histidine kinase [Bdellovibrionales bacterium]
MKSKTKAISKNTPATKAKAKEVDLAVGHTASGDAFNHDPVLLSTFKAYQSNLLSMLSHELKTPLTGIINGATALLTHGARNEWSDMILRNAERLQKTVESLLDLAAIEGGFFHAQFRAVNGYRLLENRVRAWKERFLALKLGLTLKGDQPKDVLEIVDPKRLIRALDLVFESIESVTARGTEVVCTYEPHRMEVCFRGNPDRIDSWLENIQKAKTAVAVGLASPASAFGATLQSEAAFLSRTEEGIGSEWVLLHEIARRHEAEIRADLIDVAFHEVRVQIKLLKRTHEDQLLAVLRSRMAPFQESNFFESAIALLVIRPVKQPYPELWVEKVRAELFRASDTVWEFPEQDLAALLLEDCRPSDAKGLLARIETALGFQLRVGGAFSPAETLDSEELFMLARSRMLRQGTLSQDP